MVALDFMEIKPRPSEDFMSETVPSKPTRRVIQATRLDHSGYTGCWKSRFQAKSTTSAAEAGLKTKLLSQR